MANAKVKNDVSRFGDSLMATRCTSNNNQFDTFRYTSNRNYFDTCITTCWFLYAHLQTGRIMVWWCQPCLHPPIFCTFLLHSLTLSWNFAHDYFNVQQIKFECRHFASIFEGAMPPWTYIGNVLFSVLKFLLHNFTYLAEILRIKFECRHFASIFIRPSSDGTYYGMVMSGSPSVRHSFPHFSPTCFEILSWNFVHHFILMQVRSSSSTINFRQFLLELCPFWTSHSYKYAVFCTFLINALTYWAEILHMTLFYSTSDQVWVS